ncbi:MAG: DUF4382 domain-containing protein [Candidatus Electrothrix sp. LOE2]|nr:DUF4382 domain-containing protein [Candidatus Electrothrix sp. LOE2]
MLRLKSLIWYLVLLSLAFPLGNVWAKQSKFNIDAVSDVTLDVVRFEACIDDTDECVIAGGPKQVNLLDLADGRVDFAKQVLLPDNTTELRLVLGESSTITVDGESFPLTVPSGQTSGLKLKGRKAFGKEGGFLSGLTLDLNLRKQLVVQAKKVRHKEKGRHGKKKVSYVYSYKLKPVIKVATAEVEALPENMAAVVALPDEDVTLTLGDDFSMQIPAGAVSEATIITAEELKYFVEVKDEATGEIVRKPGLASTYELGPEGTQFDKPLKVAIGYHTDTLPSRISENDLAVFHDGKRVLSDIETASRVAVADISHFSTVTVSYGVCEETVVEDGIVHRNCGDKAGYPDMHVVLIDRYKLRNQYKLRVLADDSWNGTFTTQTVEKLSQDNDAIVAINGSYFDGVSGFYRYSSPQSGASPIYTTVMGGDLRQYISGPEVFIAFGDKGDNSSIPIEKVTKERFSDYLKGIYPVNSLMDTRSLDDPTLFKFSLPNILSWAIGTDATILKVDTENEYSCNVCNYSGDRDKMESAIGYTDDKIIFVVSDLASSVHPAPGIHIGDSEFDTWESLCETFRVHGFRTQAVELDHGCSAQLAIKGDLKNGYCNSEPGEERHVVNAIGLVPKDKADPEPPEIIVDSIVPLTATLNQRAMFTVTGQRLPSELKFSLDGCEGVDRSLVSSTSMVFFCTPRIVGDQNGTINDPWYGPLKNFTVTVSEAPTALPVVNSVTPTEAVLGESTIFTVTGQNLPSTLAFWIADCENPTPSGGTSTSMKFRCTPGWSIGRKDGVVKDEEGGTTLYSFQVNVSDEPPVTLPVINSVTPTEVVLNQPTTFTVTGQNLPSTLAFWIGECQNVNSLGGSSTLMKFSCTPSWTLGIKDGVVKDQPGGTTLKEFTVDVADAPSDDDLVLKEVRVTANGTLYAGSTATYTAVADLAENITTGSFPKPGNVVKTIEVTDECSWLVTPGMYADSLGGGLVQAESSAAGQEVKVKCTYYHIPSNLEFTGTLPVIVSGGNTTSPVVYSVTPNEAVLGESTVFTVSGQDLPSTLAFWIEECENLTSLGGGSTSRQFRCTPTWTTGWKDGVVKDEPNGNVLYNFNVDVADAPVTSPVVYSVTPTDAVLDQSTTFTVSGQNLPSTLAFWIEECENLTSLGGSSTSRQFRCTPTWSIGWKEGVVKDQSGGTVLKEFSVYVSL